MAKRYANVDALIKEIGENEVKRLFEEYILRLLRGNEKSSDFSMQVVQYLTDFSDECADTPDISDCENGIRDDEIADFIDINDISDVENADMLLLGNPFMGIYRLIED